jgi:hypothetical protein
MPKNPDRPKIKYKRVGRKPPPPKKTPEEIAARAQAKLEARYHISPTVVCDAIVRERGLLRGVCRMLKMPRTTLVRYIDKHEVCMQALHVARDDMGDVAEKKLYELIEAGDVRCILYYLSTVHRSRGYGLRTDEDPTANNGRGAVFVETVNIVGVPSGTFLPKEIAAKDDMVIDN